MPGQGPSGRLRSWCLCFVDAYNVPTRASAVRSSTDVEVVVADAVVVVAVSASVLVRLTVDQNVWTVVDEDERWMRLIRAMNAVGVVESSVAVWIELDVVASFVAGHVSVKPPVTVLWML